MMKNNSLHVNIWKKEYPANIPCRMFSFNFSYIQRFAMLFINFL